MRKLPLLMFAVISVFTAKSATNIALNQTYDANAFTENVGNAFNDQTTQGTGGWSSKTYTGWISVEFDKLARVDSMTFFYTASPGNTTTQEIYVTSDGENWTLHETINPYLNLTGNEIDSVSHVFSSPIIDTKGIKVVTTQNSSWVSWIEIQVWGELNNPSSATNIALNQTYDANAFTENVGNAFNDQTTQGTGGWSSKTYTGWISVEFDKLARVDSMTFFYTASPGNTTTQEIYVTSDGENWTLHETINPYLNLTGNEIDSVSHVFSSPIIDTKGIKVVTTQNSSWVSWIEIQVWGELNGTITSVFDAVDFDENRTIIDAYNLQGQQVPIDTKNNVIILRYSDGSSEKVFIQK